MSYDNAKKHSHLSVADNIVQKRREQKIIMGKRLHSYANLYFDARNPMLYRLKDRDDLCVLEINADVLNIWGTVVTDGNAASKYTNFYSASQLTQLKDFDTIYSSSWHSEDRIAYLYQQRKKCVEVLIPNKISTDYINKAFVPNKERMEQLLEMGFDKPITISGYLFLDRREQYYGNYDWKYL